MRSLLQTPLVLPVLALSVFLVSLSSCAQAASSSSEKPSRIVFYMQDRQLIPNNTGVAVAAQGGNLTRYDFGTVFIIDDPLTETTSNTSKQVGRGQGMYTVVSRTNFHLLVSFSAYLEAYNMSTIVFHGSYPALDASREIPIAAGTGYFRGVKGHAIVSTPVDLGLYVVLKFDCFLDYESHCAPS